MYEKKSHGWYKHKDFILLDLICLFLAFLLAHFIRVHSYINLIDNGIYRNAELLEMGIVVHINLSKIHKTKGQKQFVEKIGDYTVITTSMNYATDRQAMVKRLMDIAGGLVGCLLTGIIFIFVGPAIYISSPGPIFFSQTRIGKNGKPFKMYKFRSMYMDAEARKAELMSQNKMSDGRMFKIDFDPRVIGNKVLPDGRKKTGIGEFIRKTSLDEFPQFWNVLNGVGGIIEPTEKKLDFTGFSLA